MTSPVERPKALSDASGQDAMQDLRLIQGDFTETCAPGWTMRIGILFDAQNDGPCYLSAILLSPDDAAVSITRIDDVFANARVLSAHLQAEVGTHWARKFLYAHGVAKNHGLWSLNHDGWADMSETA